MASFITFVLLCSTAVAVAQAPVQSIKPVATNQLEVYRAFLSDWQAGSKSRLNVANATDPFQPDKDDLQGCMKSFPKHSRAMETHLFPEQFTNERIHLSDPATYKVADVGEFMRRREDLDSAVQAAFEAGLMTLSEVLFDRTHRLAALNFSFTCGRLCGHGGTVIYERKNGHWNDRGNFVAHG